MEIIKEIIMCHFYSFVLCELANQHRVDHLIFCFLCVASIFHEWLSLLSRTEKIKFLLPCQSLSYAWPFVFEKTENFLFPWTFVEVGPHTLFGFDNNVTYKILGELFFKWNILVPCAFGLNVFFSFANFSYFFHFLLLFKCYDEFHSIQFQMAWFFMHQTIIAHSK